MASLELRNRRALSAGQFAWDNAEPPAEPDRWIDCPQGKDWLDSSIDALISGCDVVISFGDQLKVTAAEFISEFGQRAIDIYANDPKSALEWGLARGLFFGGPQYQELAREVAKAMLLEHEKAAEKAHAWIGDI